jgi:hypothetical protein
MKRFYKTMALVSLLGISNFSYGAAGGAGAIRQEMTQPGGNFLERCKNWCTDLGRWLSGNHAASVLTERDVEQFFTIPFLTEEDIDQFFTLFERRDYKSIGEFISKKKDAKDACGKTLFHEAVFREDNKAISVLINAGADVNAGDIYTRTPLHVATFSNGNTKAVKVLIAAGVNKEAKDSHGWTPLYGTSAGFVKVLLAAGASRNVKDECENTPLHYARSASLKRLLA